MRLYTNRKLRLKPYEKQLVVILAEAGAYDEAAAQAKELHTDAEIVTCSCAFDAHEFLFPNDEEDNRYSKRFLAIKRVVVLEHSTASQLLGMAERGVSWSLMERLMLRKLREQKTTIKQFERERIAEWHRKSKEREEREDVLSAAVRRSRESRV